MFKGLYDMLRGSAAPLEQASRELDSMLTETQAMLLEASAICWGKPATADQRADLDRRDARVHTHEVAIRRAVIDHLGSGETRAVPFALKLMSVVKDVERLGDYAKNLADIAETCGTPPERAIYQYVQDPPVAALCEVVREVESLARKAPAVFQHGEADAARELTTRGRATAARCTVLLGQVAAGDYPADVAVNLALTIRFYKRILGHYLNILSAVIMPLDKIDFFAEDFAQE